MLARRIGSWTPTALPLIMVLVLTIGCVGQGQSVTGIVPTDWPAGMPMPVEVPLPETPEAAGLGSPHKRMLVRVSIAGEPATVMPADIHQVDPPGRGRAVILRFLLNLKQPDLGRPIAIRIPTTPGRIVDAAITSRYEEPFLHVTAPNNAPILSYWHGSADSRNAKRYPLNDFIHPLIGLDGETLTAASPGDHVHHRGVFWAWVRTERHGKWRNEWWIPRDFIAEPGRLDHDEAGLTSCRFRAEHFWVYRPAEAAPNERFVQEIVDCRAYAASADGRAVDVDLTLTALVDGIRIGGQTDLNKGYGGMTCRFAAATDVRMENDRGLIESTSLNHVVASWVNWTGRFVGPDGKRQAHRSGAALMVHPSHPAYPPEWIVRAYGPVGLAYPGLEMIELPRGKPLHLRYRFWIHRGGATEGKVPEAYRAYCADWKWRAE